MKADALSLSSALAIPEADFYTIPPCYRPYTWFSFEYEALWEDLTGAFNSFVNAQKTQTKMEPLFLGPMVFVKNESSKRFDVIDGQQRTITIHILLWYLFKAMNDETEKLRLKQILTFLGGQPKLKVSQRDLATFLKVQETDTEIDDNNNLAICANFFLKKISKLADKKAFSEFIREKVQFFVIVADDYQKAWDLSIGLSGKWALAKTTDFVKAFVYGKSGVGDETSKIWEEKIVPLKDHLDSFLYYLISYKSNKFLRSHKTLFREFIRQFPNIKTLDIASFVDIYSLFWLEPLDSISKSLPGSFSFTVEARRSLRLLRLLNRRDITTLLFILVSKYGKYCIFNEALLKTLAAFQVRMGLAQKRTREIKMITWFGEAFKVPNEESEAKARFQKALEIIRNTLRSEAPDDSTFEQHVMSSSYDNYPAWCILQQNEEGTRGDRKIDDYQIEHLMPQAGTDFWFRSAGVLNKENNTVDRDSYDRIVNNIGNLFVIDPTTNNEVINEEFSVKKKFYQDKLQTWTIAIKTAEKTNWSPKDIELRANEIASWAKSYWMI